MVIVAVRLGKKVNVLIKYGLFGMYINYLQGTELITDQITSIYFS